MIIYHTQLYTYNEVQDEDVAKLHADTTSRFDACETRQTEATMTTVGSSQVLASFASGRTLLLIMVASSAQKSGATAPRHEGLLSLRHVVVTGRRVDEVVVDLFRCFQLLQELSMALARSVFNHFTPCYMYALKGGRNPCQKS